MVVAFVIGLDARVANLLPLPRWDYSYYCPYKVFFIRLDASRHLSFILEGVVE